MSESLLSVEEAASLSEIAPRMIRKAIQDGNLPAVRHGERAFGIDPKLFTLWVHTRPSGRGRQPSAQSAWNQIETGDPSWVTDPDLSDNTRRKLRSRADFRRFYVHRSVLAKLKENPLLVLSGTHAAAHWGVPVDPDDQRIVAYVAEPDLQHIPSLTVASPGADWNLELGVVPNDAWRLGRHCRYVNPLVAWLDLEDRQDRSARLVIDILPKWWRERST